MTDKEKIREILNCENCKKQLFIGGVKCPPTCTAYNDLMKMAQWKDEQYKTAYVMTRSEEHDDYVEQVFFDEEKANEYCKLFNNDKNSYRRNITKVRVSL